jgi:hypothetical protein
MLASPAGKKIQKANSKLLHMFEHFVNIIFSQSNNHIGNNYAPFDDICFVIPEKSGIDKLNIVI